MRSVWPVAGDGADEFFKRLAAWRINSFSIGFSWREGGKPAGKDRYGRGTGVRRDGSRIGYRTGTFVPGERENDWTELFPTVWISVTVWICNATGLPVKVTDMDSCILHFPIRRRAQPEKPAGRAMPGSAEQAGKGTLSGRLLFAARDCPVFSKRAGNGKGGSGKGGVRRFRKRPRPWNRSRLYAHGRGAKKRPG